MGYEPIRSVVSKGRDQEMTNETGDREEKHPSDSVQTEMGLPVLTVRNLNRSVNKYSHNKGE